MNQEESIADLLLNDGVSAFQSGQVKAALDKWVTARSIYSFLNKDRDVAGCDVNIAIAFSILGQPQRTKEHYQKARAIFERLELEKDLISCDMGIGIALLELGQPQQAIEGFRQARAVFERLRSKKDVAKCEANIAKALNELGQPEQAKFHYEKAKTIFDNLGLKKDVATCHKSIGSTLREMGQPQQAIEHYQQARRILDGLGLEREVAYCEGNLGNAYHDLGEFQLAIAHHLRARAIFERFELEYDLAICDLNLGSEFRDLDEPQQAIEHYQRARVVFDHFGLKKEAAVCDTGIGAVLHKLGQPEQAKECFQRAKAIFESLGFESDIAISNNGLAATQLLLASREKPDVAQPFYQQALKHLEDAILTFEKLRTNISVSQHRISFFERFIGSYEEAIRCCLHLGQISEALHYLERSRSKVLAEAVSGNLIPDQNEIGKELYAEFLNLRARLRQEGLLPMVKSDFNAKPESDDSGSTRRQAQQDFDTLVQRIAREFPKSAFTRKLAATEVRYLKEADEYVGLLPDNRSCLLEFLAWTDDGRLRAFLVTKQKKLELVVFPEGSLERLAGIWQQWKKMYVDVATLNDEERMKNIVGQTCHQLHELIFAAEIEVVRQSGGAGAATDAQRQRLLDYLDATLEQGDEKQPRRMYLIPHAQLFFMPLHAACWSEQSAKETNGTKQQEPSQPHYLIEDYLCIYAPSAYLLKISQERQYAESEGPRAIVVGNPKPVPEGMQSLSGAKVEAEDAAKLLIEKNWKVDSLIEEGATKQRYLNGDERGVAGINKGVYHHQHLALHGNFGADGKQAGLLFGASSEDYVCDAGDIAGAPLQTMRSVIAAACYSSATDLSEQSTNEYLGMAAAFLQAGVGTFIGTLYPLSDAGSRWSVPELYRLHLQQGLSWADALRRAQLAGVMASGTSRARRGLGATQQPDVGSSLLNHPYHWAAFTISGKE